MKHRIGLLALKLFGWRIEGEPPTEPRYVAIAAPHTSWWDFPVMIAMGWAFQVKVHWMGKHTLFREPFGGIMRKLGGIPIRRDQRSNTVEQVAEWFARSERLILMVPPEGTRRRTEYWKSGFYRIAERAGVPICLGYIDFGTKSGSLGPLLWPSGDVKHDMDQIRAFYRDKRGYNPELFGEVRLRDEEQTLPEEQELPIARIA